MATNVFPSGGTDQARSGRAAFLNDQYWDIFQTEGVSELVTEAGLFKERDAKRAQALRGNTTSVNHLHPHQSQFLGPLTPTPQGLAAARAAHLLHSPVRNFNANRFMSDGIRTPDVNQQPPQHILPFNNHQVGQFGSPQITKRLGSTLQSMHSPTISNGNVFSLQHHPHRQPARKTKGNGKRLSLPSPMPQHVTKRPRSVQSNMTPVIKQLQQQRDTQNASAYMPFTSTTPQFGLTPTMHGMHNETFNMLRMAKLKKNHPAATAVGGTSHSSSSSSSSSSSMAASPLTTTKRASARQVSAAKKAAATHQQRKLTVAAASNSSNSSTSKGSTRSPAPRRSASKQATPKTTPKTKRTKKSDKSTPVNGKTTVRVLEKGLRLFSLRVCRKVEQKKITTYNDVADELVQDLRADMPEALPNARPRYDPKNIRRRVYDALNVLMAMDIITKDKKKITWLGLPAGAADISSSDTLAGEVQKSTSRLEAKKRQLADLQWQYLAMTNLLERNARAPLAAHQQTIQTPFIVVSTPKQTVIEIEMNAERNNISFKLDDSYEVRSSEDVLQLMGLACASAERLRETFPQTHQYYHQDLIA